MFPLGFSISGPAAPPPPPPHPSPPGADSIQDPHLTFPGNKHADFRGHPDRIFSMISAPKLALNVRIDYSVFRLKNATINGTFMTEAYIRCGDSRVAHSAWNATDQNYGWDAAWFACRGSTRHGRIFPHMKRACRESNLTLEMEYATLHTRCGHWYTRTSVRSVFDRIHGAPRRIDIHVEGSDRAHGIIGQNLANPRDGARDVYPSTGTYTTSAQAEGAIHGQVSDYIVKEPFSAEFKYSIFHSSSSRSDVNFADAGWTKDE